MTDRSHYAVRKIRLEDKGRQPPLEGAEPFGGEEIERSEAAAAERVSLAFSPWKRDLALFMAASGLDPEDIGLLLAVHPADDIRQSVEARLPRLPEDGVDLGNELKNGRDRRSR